MPQGCRYSGVHEQITLRQKSTFQLKVTARSSRDDARMRSIKFGASRSIGISLSRSWHPREPVFFDDSMQVA